jgi:hypothetical protein
MHCTQNIEQCFPKTGPCKFVWPKIMIQNIINNVVYNGLLHFFVVCRLKFWSTTKKNWEPLFLLVKRSATPFTTLLPPPPTSTSAWRWKTESYRVAQSQRFVFSNCMSHEQCDQVGRSFADRSTFLRPNFLDENSQKN